MASNVTPKLVFVANELGNFWHHKGHLVQAARDNGLQPILLAAPAGEAPGLDCEYRPLAIERFRFDPLGDARLALVILRLLLRERPKAIHLINIKPYLFGGLAARLARLGGWDGRVVVSVTGLGRLHATADRLFSLANVRRRFVEFMLRIAVKGARVTFETASDHDFWIRRRLIAREQAVVTQGTGIDLDRFPFRRTAPENGGLKALFAGRLLRTKGLDVFLEAASLIGSPDIEMRVAGFAEKDPDALSVASIRARQDVTFLGAVSDMAGLLAETDIVVLPSRYNEGVPRILIEAAASGCVPIATRFAGSEMVIEHGRTGLFLDHATPAEQARQLATFIKDLAGDRARCRTIGENAAAHVRGKGFAAKDITSVFVELYLEPFSTR